MTETEIAVLRRDAETLWADARRADAAVALAVRAATLEWRTGRRSTLAAKVLTFLEAKARARAADRAVEAAEAARGPASGGGQ